jgi:hypothetical protein
MSLEGYSDENTENIDCWGLHFAPLALPKGAEFHGNGPWWLHFKSKTPRGSG